MSSPITNIIFVTSLPLLQEYLSSHSALISLENKGCLRVNNWIIHIYKIQSSLILVTTYVFLYSKMSCLPIFCFILYLNYIICILASLCYSKHYLSMILCGVHFQCFLSVNHYLKYKFKTYPELSIQYLF